MKENLEMENLMVKENIHIKMEIFMLAILKIINIMAMEYTNGKMAIITKENRKMEKGTEKEK